MYTQQHPKYERKAKLENGEIVNYDLCSEQKTDYQNCTYLGKGTIWKINNKKQNRTRTMHFYATNRP